MILNRSFKLTAKLGLALSAVCFTAHLASAQAGGAAYKSSFTLPFEARWGHVVLAPGNYSFTLDHAMVGGVVTISRGKTGPGMAPVFVFSQGGSDQQRVERSELVLVRSGGNYAVRSLRLADPGLTLEYAVPKAEKASEAPVVQRIPIMPDGK